MNNKKTCDRGGCNDMAVWTVYWIQKSECNSDLGCTYISIRVPYDFDILYLDKIINVFNLFVNSTFFKKSFITIYFLFTSFSIRAEETQISHLVKIGFKNIF